MSQPPRAPAQASRPLPASGQGDHAGIAVANVGRPVPTEAPGDGGVLPTEAPGDGGVVLPAATLGRHLPPLHPRGHGLVLRHHPPRPAATNPRAPRVWRRLVAFALAVSAAGSAAGSAHAVAPGRPFREDLPTVPAEDAPRARPTGATPRQPAPSTPDAADEVPRADALAIAAAEAARFPEDYGALVAWARAADAAGAFDEAARAWEAAQAVSGGGLEARAGFAVSRYAGGRTQEARAAAAAATEAWPEAASAWDLRADLAAGPDRPAGLTAVFADPWRRRAAELDPAYACDAAVSALALGDLHAARRSAGPAGCPGASGLDAPAWTGWGAVWAVGLGQTGAARSVDGGLSGLVQGGADWDGRVSLSATVRSLGWNTPDDALGWSTQTEVWATLTGRSRHLGGTALVGGIWPAGSSPWTAPSWTIGGRAWGQAWATVVAEGAFSRQQDGDSAQAGLSVSVPVWRALRASAGIQFTRFDGADVDAVDAWSGWAATRWEAERWTLGGTVRVGRELRPVRFDEPSMWNFPAPLGSSIELATRLRLRPGLWLHLGYDLAAIPGATDDGAVPSTDIALHQGVTGLVFTDALWR